MDSIFVFVYIYIIFWHVYKVCMRCTIFCLFSLLHIDLIFMQNAYKKHHIEEKA